MNKHELALYQRIQAFDLDKVDAKITFAQRLQREHRWTAAYANRVVDEYRKFLLLAMVAGHKVIPSDQVDQAWHLHLTNSRSYWDELCPKILGKNLHHEANPGGRSEQINHHQGYQQTLASYELIFGQTPPADIWPSVKLRFGRDIHFVRVNSFQNWIIKKPDIPFKCLCSPVFLMTLSLLLVGCDTQGLDDLLDDLNDVAKRSSGSALFFYSLILLLLEFGLAYLLKMIIRCWEYFLFKWRNRPRKIPLTTDELAYFRGGYKRILELSMVKSLQQFYNDHPAVKRTADAADWQREASQPQYSLRVDIFEKQLIKKGLLTPSSPSSFAIACWFLWMFWSLFVSIIAMDCILKNIPNDLIRFIDFCIVMGGFIFFLYLSVDDNPSTITGTCKQMLDEKQTQIESKMCERQLLQGKLTGEQLNEAVAIVGLDALRYSEFPELTEPLDDYIRTTYLQATSSKKSGHSYSGDTDGGCSSHDSDSSSHDSDYGSGCGGCGGCGGD